jgi:competence protein ComEC
MWLFAVGFQLSFAAVLSLIIFYPPISRWVYSPWTIGNVLWRVVAASLAAQVLTAPLSVYYFHNFPLWFLVANVFAWVMLGACGLIGGLLILALSWAPPLASLVATIVTWLMKGFNWIVLLLQKGNPASWSHLQISGAQMMWLYAVITCTAIFLFHKRHLALYGALASLCVFLTLISTSRYTALKQDRLIVYAGTRHTFIERIIGASHQPLFADTSWEAARQTTKDTRIGLRAWRAASPATQDVFRVAGKTVLLLGDTLTYETHSPFPVDVLIVNRSLKGLSPSSLKTIFMPQLIVIGGGHRRWQAVAWRDSCAAIGQAFHSAGLDGGWASD